MKNTAAADIVIFGGGIAGLWLLNRLRHAGFSPILFESNALGGGQTHKSQGIIHGGMKYALQGVLTNEAQVMADMPNCWKQCLAGNGEIDLSAVPILSTQQHLWAANKLTAKLAGLLASTALTSKVAPVLPTDYPLAFQNTAFKGEIFSLDELVIDVSALVRELVKANQDAVYKIEPLSEEGLRFDDQGKLLSASVCLSGKTIEVSAQQFIFTAGAGNEMIIKKLNLPHLAMQRRPLHMVMVKTPFDYPLYAHCLGIGPRPRITITTHYLQDGSAVWYLGGQLAEEGIHRDSHTQAEAARQELRALFPWLDFSAAEIATVMIDRAEPFQKSGLKPDNAYFKTFQNVTVAWPTKLALAPKLAADLLSLMQQSILPTSFFDTRELRSWPMPPLARSIGDELFCKNVA